MALTIKETIRRIKLIEGMTARWIADTREYRVNYKGGEEKSAYYTGDAIDAIGTALQMREWQITNDAGSAAYKQAALENVRKQVTL